MKTRALTFEESRQVFLTARDELGVPENYMFSEQQLAFTAVVLRVGLREFCKANGLEPPPEPGS